MAQVLSVNVGRRKPCADADIGVTGIGKRSVGEAVTVRAPGPKGTGGSGLVGDDVCDRRHHGGNDQAVYAYAREDLDFWETELGRPLAAGLFGENLTTGGIDLHAALVGQRLRIGDTLELEVTEPRIPCRTFAATMGESRWVRTFTRHARPGTYLRVHRPGRVRAGDPIALLDAPQRSVSVGTAFRALTAEPELLDALAEVLDVLPADLADTVRRRQERPMRTNGRKQS